MPAFDPLTYRYASRRNVVYAKNAVACTSVPLGAIATDNENAPVEYFDLRGQRVDNPANGFFIRRQGNKVEKIVVR